jgi:hypothetical protein
MIDKVKKQEGGQRNRPAMAESTRDRGKLYRRISNVLLIIFIILLISMTPIIPIVNVVNPLHGILPLSTSFLFLIAAPCMVGVIILRKKARRHVSPRFVNLESPPGVLFLRPFSEDKDWRVYYSWGRDRRPTGFLDRLQQLKFELGLQYRSTRRGAHFEDGEILSELTGSFGNMAAIGEPGSPPILGADNVYVSDDNWQEEVLQMARGAKLVILTAGTTPGVLWETENMIRVVPPLRLLLNIPGGTPAKRRKNYKAFLASAENRFPKGLPKQLKARVISFKDDWTPVEVTKKQPPESTSAHVAWWMSRVLP